jgi:hypothetical protein
VLLAPALAFYVVKSARAAVGVGLQRLRRPKLQDCCSRTQFLIERLLCAPESLAFGEEIAFRVRLHTDAASSKHKLSTREFVLGGIS